MTEISLEFQNVVRGMRRHAQFSRVSGLAMISILVVLGTGTALLFIQTLSTSTIYIGPQSNLANALIQTQGVEWIPELTKSLISDRRLHNGRLFDQRSSFFFKI